MKVNFKFWIRALFLSVAWLKAGAADQITVTINHQTISLYRTADLDTAKQEAMAADKPIGWIASAPQLLDGRGTISGETSRSATLHAIYALRGKTVLIFEDAYAENHKVLAIVDHAVHSPDPHPTPPIVVMLNPKFTKVLATVNYERDFVKRAHLLADALEQANVKMKPAPDAARQ